MDQMPSVANLRGLEITRTGVPVSDTDQYAEDNEEAGDYFENAHDIFCQG